MSKLKLDRRLVACVLTFGLITTYMILPVAFGGILLNYILLANLNSNNLNTVHDQLPTVILISALDMIISLLFAVFVSNSKPKEYEEQVILAAEPEEELSSKILRLPFVLLFRPLQFNLLLVR